MNINKLLPFIIRIIISSAIFIYFKHSINSIFIILILSVLFDYIDTYPNIPNIISPERFTQTFTYQKYDKITDIIVYFVILYNYKHLFDKQTYNLLCTLLIYRIIGVYLFFIHNNTKYLHFFFDGVNVVMLVYYISLFNKSIKNNYILTIIISLIIKYKFEIKLHNKIKYKI